MDAIVCMSVFGWYVLVDGEEEEGAGVRRWMSVKERATPTRGAAAAVTKSTSESWWCE